MSCHNTFVMVNLLELGITLPDATAPLANYVPYVISGKHVYFSGQICKENGEISYKGLVGTDLDISEGKKAARVCAINLLAQLNQACNGDLTKVARCVKLGVFVACAADFTQHSEVANGASELFVEVFGEKGRHSRSAIGVSSLPFNTAVEVEAVFELI